MIVMGLDPSSTIIGYAVLGGLEPGDLIAAGLLHPSLARELLGHMPTWQRDYLLGAHLPAYRRTLSMIGDVTGLICEYAPARIVVEIPSGKFGTGAKRGARGSLTTYGMAAGMVVQAVADQAGDRCIPVDERTWTAGGGNKEQRQLGISLVYQPRYKAADDQGGDVSDAIGLARWWYYYERDFSNKSVRSNPACPTAPAHQR